MGNFGSYLNLNRLFVVASFFGFLFFLICKFFCYYHRHDVSVEAFYIFGHLLYAACIFSFDSFLTRHPSFENQKKKQTKTILNMRIDDADDDICSTTGEK